MSEYCHKRLKKGPVKRGILEAEVEQKLGFTGRQIRPAFSDLLTVDKYNHLVVAD
jgi:hypothetical protein